MVIATNTNKNEIKENYKNLVESLNSNNGGVKIQIEFDPLVEMVQECCKVFPEPIQDRPYIPIQDLFNLHQVWYEAHSLQPLNIHAFGKRIKKAFSFLKKRRLTFDKKLTWVYEGISILSPDFSIDNLIQ